MAITNNNNLKQTVGLQDQFENNCYHCERKTFLGTNFYHSLSEYYQPIITPIPSGTEYSSHVMKNVIKYQLLYMIDNGCQ